MGKWPVKGGSRGDEREKKGSHPFNRKELAETVWGVGGAPSTRLSRGWKPKGQRKRAATPPPTIAWGEAKTRTPNRETPKVDKKKKQYVQKTQEEAKPEELKTDALTATQEKGGEIP